MQKYMVKKLYLYHGQKSWDCDSMNLLKRTFKLGTERKFEINHCVKEANLFFQVIDKNKICCAPKK